MDSCDRGAGVLSSSVGLEGAGATGGVVRLGVVLGSFEKSDMGRDPVIGK